MWRARAQCSKFISGKILLGFIGTHTNFSLFDTEQSDELMNVSVRYTMMFIVYYFVLSAENDTFYTGKKVQILSIEGGFWYSKLDLV
jgi:hypothetical protein